jgi:hypothetical protein
MIEDSNHTFAKLQQTFTFIPPLLSSTLKPTLSLAQPATITTIFSSSL